MGNTAYTVHRSMVLPAFFPSAKTALSGLEAGLRAAKESGFDTVELFYAGPEPGRAAGLVRESGLRSVVLGPMLTKSEGLSLCAVEERLRARAVDAMKRLIEQAYAMGSVALLINSGRMHEGPGEREVALERLKESVVEVLEYSREAAAGYEVEIRLEPGDVDVHHYELVGSTDTAVALAREMRRKYDAFSLTMDTSHLRQLSEDPMESLRKAEPVCRHIHLANCVLNDRGSALYGDMHPAFGVGNGEFSVEAIRGVYEAILSTYRKEIDIGIEIICREEDEERHFRSVMKSMRWFVREGGPGGAGPRATEGNGAPAGRA